MLLHHHFLTIPLPPAPGLWSGLRHTLNAGRRRRRLERVVAQTDATVRHADLTIVSNDRDAAALVRNVADPDRIAVLPLGLTSRAAATVRRRAGRRPGPAGRRVRWHVRPAEGDADSPPSRSGGPQGARGDLPVARDGRASTGRRRGAGYFPRRLWPRLEIHPRYDPNELPAPPGRSFGRGVPSRVESFGYGYLRCWPRRSR